MSVDDIIKKFQDKLDEINQLKENLLKELRPGFTELFSTFFNENPEVKLITWAQGTPYYNDGDPCEFGVRELKAYLDPEGYNENEEEEFPLYNFMLEDCENDIIKYDDIPNMLKKVENFDRLKEINQGVKDLQKLHNSVPDDLMQGLFGDPVTVYVTRDGIETEEREDF